MAEEMNEGVNEKFQNGMNEQFKLIQQLQAIENMAKQKMSKEAISRYGNIKMAHPEMALKAITAIAQAVQLGQINSEIDDKTFKTILTELQQNKKQFKFVK